MQIHRYFTYFSCPVVSSANYFLPEQRDKRKILTIQHTIAELCLSQFSEKKSEVLQPL